ncbi:hypothetical protein KQ51_00582 [Candidatus Izimaplasma bacterium HR1]|jgi:hypothetical protein|uniref:hypothetical protein n=1 Tax=Candidatus Izimoplasma sp. HR1 TaxID=1541959 RepID=UPI0004F63925|nr:hypothetical protein KQ51_00582 [Candidatus Izimaplasma bacterium HR1]
MRRTRKKEFDLVIIDKNVTITFNNEGEPKLRTLYHELKKCQIEDSDYSYTLRGNFIEFPDKKEYINMTIDLLLEKCFTPQTLCVFCEEETKEEIFVNNKYFRAHDDCYKK